MFGLIVSGRLVKTDFNQVGETQFVTALPEPNTIKHLVVFLTGVQPFPDGLGASVYFSSPEENGPVAWHLLGIISNEKPSAIFKISGLKGPQESNFWNVWSASPTNQQGLGQQAQVGISVEPLSQIAGLTPASSTEPSTVNSFVEFSRYICENLYNFASSFAHPPEKIVPAPNEQYLPVSVLSKWYENFLRKLEYDPYFWKK